MSILKRLYDIKVDKYLHFICGLVMAEVIFAIVVHFLPLLAALGISLGVSTIVGAGKEWVYDKKHGVPNKKDFYATEVGVVLGLLIMLI